MFQIMAMIPEILPSVICGMQTMNEIENHLLDGCNQCRHSHTAWIGVPGMWIPIVSSSVKAAFMFSIASSLLLGSGCGARLRCASNQSSNPTIGCDWRTHLISEIFDISTQHNAIGEILLQVGNGFDLLVQIVVQQSLDGLHTERDRKITW
jgi:hypothetical protein